MLSQETDVLNLIKNVRAIHRTMEIKIKLTKEEEQYIEKSRYKRIQLTSDEEEKIQRAKTIGMPGFNQLLVSEAMNRAKKSRTLLPASFDTQREDPQDYFKSNQSTNHRQEEVNPQTLTVELATLKYESNGAQTAPKRLEQLDEEEPFSNVDLLITPPPNRDDKHPYKSVSSREGFQ